MTYTLIILKLLGTPIVIATFDDLTTCEVMQRVYAEQNNASNYAIMCISKE